MDDRATANLILLGQIHFNQARWWTLAAAWMFGRHRIVRHLGRVGRIDRKSVV